MSWTQEEWDAWKQGTWGQQTAASPATPPSWPKPKDFGSPHGPSDKHDTNPPKAFHSDRNFYDTNEVYGLQLPSSSTGVKLGSKAPTGGPGHHSH